MPIMNALFAQARAEGQQWFFASGDTGSDGCRDGSGNKIMSAGWPASSPNVVGVGGTTVSSATAESAWTDAGGGPSESLDKPAYQTALTPADSSRDEPDVAAIAGGSGVAIVDNGSATAVGGTSAATPIVAGLYAVLLQQKAQAGKGFTNALEQFYTLAAAHKGFHDITTGTQVGPSGTGTGGYKAAAGYDMVTGVGTLNLTDLIANWQ
jgi:kumamolisin